VATRDAMAKCLYGALFDWIVLKVNQALLAKRHNSEHQVTVSIVYYIYYCKYHLCVLGRYILWISDKQQVQITPTTSSKL